MKSFPFYQPHSSLDRELHDLKTTPAPAGRFYVGQKKPAYGTVTHWKIAPHATLMTYAFTEAHIHALVVKRTYHNACLWDLAYCPLQYTSRLSKELISAR